MHEWELIGPHKEAGQSVWVCARCKEKITEKDGEAPEPDFEFWSGIGSITLNCDEMIVDEISNS